MDLIVYEMKPQVYQALTATKDTLVKAVRPHIYRHLSPSGSIKVQIKSSDGATLLGESEAVAISSIESGSNYFHGYVTLSFNASVWLTAGTTYRIYIVGTGGYSFNESAYVGVCTDFDLRKYTAAYSYTTDYQAPLDIEMWELSLK